MQIGGSRGRRSAGALALVAALVILAGCASDGSTTTDAAPSTPVAPAGSAVPGTSGSGSAPSGTVGGTTPSTALVLTSSAFADGGSIPVRYACTNQGGENASPPLAWRGVPEGATTLVLVVHDPDAPLAGGFTHLVTTIPTDLDSVDDGANATGTGPMAAWIGPCPPSGEHGYEFTLYAFGPDVAIPVDPDKAAVDAIADQALAAASLTGRFAHQG